MKDLIKRTIENLEHRLLVDREYMEQDEIKQLEEDIRILKVFYGLV